MQHIFTWIRKEPMCVIDSSMTASRANKLSRGCCRRSLAAARQESGAGVLEIPPSAYWIETQSIVDLSDVNSGLLKSVAFGVLIGLSGCLRGLQAERSAAGVGQAATSAVVTGILLIIVADALFAVVFNILGW